MSTNTNKTSRIAINTLLLYIRMAVVMLVTLYTSRVVLSVLGVEDFGIYNVVSGIVVLFSFLNTAMTNASQRFLSVSISIGNRDDLIKVFSTSVYLHSLIVLIILLLTETLGLWYVKEKLSIPEGKQEIALAAYHLAVLATCINVIRVPFQALLISYEQMSMYAVISIAETFLKLAFVCLLPFVPGEKLILYSWSLVIIYVLICLFFAIYCISKYKVKLVRVSDFRLIKEFAVFSGWNMLGGVADVAYQQGTNLIINFFNGVAVNAAVGVMNQVRSAVYSFVVNLQLAANPQIIKSYSSQEYGYFFSLISLISRLSYYLSLVFVLPLILNIDFILKIWLNIVPDYSSEFCKLILIYCLIDSLSGPLWVSIQATGNMKYYQIVISLLLILNLPLSFYALRLGFPPTSVFVVQIFICVLALVCRLLLAKKYIKLDVADYLRNVVAKLILVTILTSVTTLLVANLYDGFIKLLLTFSVNLLALLLSMYFFGISATEKNKLKEYFRKRIG